MSHHGEQPFFADDHHTHNIDELSATNEKMKQLFADAGIKLGATGQHPEGKMNVKIMDESQIAFEKLYGRYNDLSKNEDGEYQDWNLELTWKCWKTAWETAKMNSNSREDK